MKESRLLRAYIREVLSPLQSHHLEPKIGSRVVNINPSCKHFRSSGEVLSIDELPGDLGKTITYVVRNPGRTFQPGDTLTKTLDQLKVVVDEKADLH